MRRAGEQRGGGEFRINPEMYARWVTANGQVDVHKVARAKDVYELITPSAERALALNKAYRAIVAEQDYLFGRDATTTPPVNVHKHLDNNTATTLPTRLFFPWDIRLDWQQAEQGTEKNLKQNAYAGGQR